MTTREILEKASAQKAAMAAADAEQKNRALREMADALRCHTADILEANRLDGSAAADTVSAVMLDRLSLTASRIEAMADGVAAVASLEDPVGRVLETRQRPNGLTIRKVSVPLGVIALIYESRPNVTSDAAALTLKSGNVCVLRGGKEAFRSNQAVTAALREGAEIAGLPADVVCLITDTSRDSARELMTAVGLVDLLIPRGGAGLIRSCVEQAKVPCIQTGTGICHIYVDESANVEQAVDVVENAKASRPSVCNAAEVCLVHRNVAAAFLPQLAHRLTEERIARGMHPVELHLDPEAAKYTAGIPARKTDFDTEFLDYILAVRVVDSLEQAVEHIRLHSTGHSESILTQNAEKAKYFTMAVDSAAVYVNASTRFTDGGEFGLGCEMGISTQKLHARGPMGLAELNSYKYIIDGNGQIR